MRGQKPSTVPKFIQLLDQYLILIRGTIQRFFVHTPNAHDWTSALLPKLHSNTPVFLPQIILDAQPKLKEQSSPAGRYLIMTVP